MKLSPLFRMIARDVALGCSLEDIAALRNVPLTEVQRVTRGGTFCKAVATLQKEIDQEIISQEAEDPVRRKMALNAMKAVDSLVEEINNDDRDAGATATTRIKASTTILELSGYSKQEETTNLAVIMLSPDKLAAVRAKPDVLKDVPDLVDGMPTK